MGKGIFTSVIKCSHCGQFVRPADAVIHQPDTPFFRLEPEDPEILCMKCAETTC